LGADRSRYKTRRFCKTSSQRSARAQCDRNRSLNFREVGGCLALGQFEISRRKKMRPRPAVGGKPSGVQCIIKISHLGGIDGDLAPERTCFSFQRRGRERGVAAPASIKTECFDLRRPSRLLRNWTPHSLAIATSKVAAGPFSRFMVIVLGGREGAAFGGTMVFRLSRSSMIDDARSEPSFVFCGVPHIGPRCVAGLRPSNKMPSGNSTSGGFTRWSSRSESHRQLAVKIAAGTGGVEARTRTGDNRGGACVGRCTFYLGSFVRGISITLLFESIFTFYLVS